MTRFIRVLAFLAGAAGIVSTTIAAPERWVFDIQDAQTSAIVGSAGAVAVIDSRASPIQAYYSLQITSSHLLPGSYTARFGVGGETRTLDFGAEATGEARLRVDPVLIRPVDTSILSPTLGIYQGDTIVYRAVLKRGSSTSDPSDGMGTLSGDCGLITSDVIRSTLPYWFENSLDFGIDPYDESDFERLSSGAQAILNGSNGGGSASVARAFAFEVLRRCEGAQLLKIADEIDYLDPAGKKTDMLVDLGGRKVGVVSRRAKKFPTDQPYTLEDAKLLLERGLGDVADSSANVAGPDRWVKQVLHVFAADQTHADQLEAAFLQIDQTLKGNTVTVITSTEGADEPLYGY
jgi:hypothetical protein